MSRSDRRPAIDHLRLIAAPGIWIFLFLLLPVLTTAILSLSWLSVSAFPYGDLPQLPDWPLAVSVTDENYRFLWQNSGYVPALLNSIRIAATATSLILMLGFPMAWGISRMRSRLRGILLTLVIVPFWASMLVRIYSWNGIAGVAGTEFAVHLGIVYAYLPLMVLCIYASLVKLDYTRVEAASDLGGRPMQIFFRVILPASRVGIIAGCLLVFVPAIGQFIVPDLLGGAASPMPGPLIWHEYFVDRNWPVAAAMALVMLVVLWAVAIPVGRKLLAAAAGQSVRPFSLNESRGRDRTLKHRLDWIGVSLFVGLGFLYLPLLVLILSSFNDSGLLTEWNGLSLKWYGQLLADPEIIGALRTSLGIAAVSATTAVILGTLAGLSLTRITLSASRRVFAALVLLPLVTPEVIFGVLLVFLFAGPGQLIGLPGAVTISIAHATVGMAYVTVFVAARLGGNANILEEAARDLGAKPFRAFTGVSLPIIAPAMLVGWLLTFSLSFDDVVIASFVAGPDTVTLPMVIYGRISAGAFAEANAIGAMLIVIIAAIAVVAWSVMRLALSRRGAGQGLLWQDR